jgi:hypothetical protein
VRLTAASSKYIVPEATSISSQNHIGKEVVYSDSVGHFLVRLSKHGPFPLSVAPEEFITNGVYEAVSAPAEVRAETEDAATSLEIVVRRVPLQR